MTSSAESHTAVPRLERPRDGRMLAGVCVGLARHLRIDPTLVRIGFVVATVLGGFGVAAYVAGFLLIPEEGHDSSLLQSVDPRRAVVVLGLILVVAGAGAALHAADIGHAGRVFWPVVLAGSGIYLLTRARDRDEGAPPPAPSVDVGASPGEAATTTFSDRPVRRGPRRRATSIVAGGMLVGAGAVVAIAASSDLGWQAGAGILVVFAGAALVAGAFLGASPWLALPPLALAAAVGTLGAADVQLRGPVGERSFHPATAAELNDTYRMAVGDLELDLRDVDLPPGTTTVKVRLGMGEARVLVPEGVGLRVTGHAGAGNVDLPGGSGDGTDVDRSETLPASGRPELVLDARVGLGEVQVDREGSGR